MKTIELSGFEHAIHNLESGEKLFISAQKRDVAELKYFILQLDGYGSLFSSYLVNNENISESIDINHLLDKFIEAYVQKDECMYRTLENAIGRKNLEIMELLGTSWDINTTNGIITFENRKQNTCKPTTSCTTCNH